MGLSIRSATGIHSPSSTKKKPASVRYEYIGWMMLKMEYQGPDSNAAWPKLKFSVLAWEGPVFRVLLWPS